MRELPRCESLNPDTQSQCDMGKGHVGCHRAGGVICSNEHWVTKCTDEPCVYHETFVKNPGYEECIHCGDRRHIELHPEAVEKKIASLRRSIGSGQCDPEVGQQEIDRLAVVCLMAMEESNADIQV